MIYARTFNSFLMAAILVLPLSAALAADDKPFVPDGGGNVYDNMTERLQRQGLGTGNVYDNQTERQIQQKSGHNAALDAPQVKTSPKHKYVTTNLLRQTATVTGGATKAPSDAAPVESDLDRIYRQNEEQLRLQRETMQDSSQQQ